MLETENARLIPGSGRSPREGNGSYSSTLAWKIPWREKPGGPQSSGSQRVGYNWKTMHACVCVWRPGDYHTKWSKSDKDK